MIMLIALISLANKESKMRRWKGNNAAVLVAVNGFGYET
jgi:hypothetical protein